MYTSRVKCQWINSQRRIVMNNAERKRSRYRVFAIYAEQPDDDPLIYIGVSRMKDLRKLFRYYRNESAIARPLFEPGISAKIMLLENRCMPGDVAYRYCLAWMRYFLAQDHISILDLLKLYQHPILN